jgi:hypothetical protein
MARAILRGAWKRELCRLQTIVLLTLVATTSTTLATEKQALTDVQLKALFENGLSVSSVDMQGGKTFTGQVTYRRDGTLSGTVTFAGRPAVPITGAWKIDGARLCRTVAPLQPQQVCETWVKSGDKEVIIRVGEMDIAVVRWP